MALICTLITEKGQSLHEFLFQVILYANVTQLLAALVQLLVHCYCEVMLAYSYIIRMLLKSSVHTYAVLL
jgi:hypothetical protein